MTRRKGSRHEQPTSELLNAPHIRRDTQLDLQARAVSAMVLSAVHGDETFAFVLPELARDLDGLDRNKVDRILFNTFPGLGYSAIADIRKAIENAPREVACA